MEPATFDNPKSGSVKREEAKNKERGYSLEFEMQLEEVGDGIGAYVGAAEDRQGNYGLASFPYKNADTLRSGPNQPP